MSMKNKAVVEGIPGLWLAEMKVVHTVQVDILGVPARRLPISSTYLSSFRMQVQGQKAQEKEQDILEPIPVKAPIRMGIG